MKTWASSSSSRCSTIQKPWWSLRRFSVMGIVLHATPLFLSLAAIAGGAAYYIDKKQKGGGGGGRHWSRTSLRLLKPVARRVHKRDFGMIALTCWYYWPRSRLPLTLVDRDQGGERQKCSCLQDLPGSLQYTSDNLELILNSKWITL